jgi:serine protease inhibitor
MDYRNGRVRTRMAMGLILAFTALSGCGGGSGSAMNSPGGTSGGTGGTSGGNGAAPPAVMTAKNDGTPVDPAVVSADNSFGLNLFQKLNAGASGNVAIAPISVAMALQILYNGAGGSTQQQMAGTLQLGAMSTQVLNNDNAALQASLMDADPQVQITLANSLWVHLSGDSANSVLPTFTQMDQTYYGATVGDLAGAPANVNAWVSSETNGLITQILPNANYAAVKAVLANVIYFKGQWSSPFDPNQTLSALFTLGDGTQVSAEMMRQTGSYAYVEGPNFQAISLPYGQGRFSMILVLPNSGVALNTFVAGITVATLNTWVSQLQMGVGNVSLPRFTSTYSTSLPPALTALGMGSVFCPGTDADFSALSSQAVCVSDVEHKTIVEVDESGTVAAGVTTVTVGPTAVPAPQFSMTLDHPFFYAIRDDSTGELLFVGTLVNPS